MVHCLKHLKQNNVNKGKRRSHSSKSEEFRYKFFSEIYYIQIHSSKNFLKTFQKIVERIIDKNNIPKKNI